MRFKLLLIAFICTLGISSNVTATKFIIGIEEGDVIIWNCNICDEEKMEEIFGNDWKENERELFDDIEQGAQMKWIVKETEDDDKIYSERTEDNETVLKITYKKWKWTKNKVWGERDNIGESTHFTDPDDYEKDLIFPNFAPIWLPLPLDDYLKTLDLYEGYAIDARVISTITCEIKKNDLKGDYPTQFVKIQAMYNDKGILSSYKLYIEDHKVIIDISLETSVPYEIYLFPAIIAIFYVGLIYIIYRKIIKT